MTQSPDVVARLNPVHLEEAQTDEDLKKLVEESEEQNTPEKKEEQKRNDDPRAQSQYEFTLNHKDAAGKVWTGSFTNKILSIQERQRAGLLQAQLSGGLPYDSLDEHTRELNLMIANLTFSLIERPKWAENLRSLQDFQIIQAIYGEVASHEAFFLGWGTDQGSGKE